MRTRTVAALLLIAVPLAAVGEHLGYGLTGAWTTLTGVALIQPTAVPGWLGVLGLVIGPALMLCGLEFVGRREPTGWKPAEQLTPMAYIAWSLWLVAIGVALLVRGRDRLGSGGGYACASRIEHQSTSRSPPVLLALANRISGSSPRSNSRFAGSPSDEVSDASILYVIRPPARSPDPSDRRSA